MHHGPVKGFSYIGMGGYTDMLVFRNQSWIGRKAHQQTKPGSCSSAGAGHNGRDNVLYLVRTFSRVNSRERAWFVYRQNVNLARL